MTSSADAPVSHDVGLLLALERVRGGHVTAGEPDAFFHRGAPLPAILVPFLRELFAHGQVQLEEPHADEPSRVVMTTAGKDLLAELTKSPNALCRPTGEEGSNRPL